MKAILYFSVLLIFMFACKSDNERPTSLPADDLAKIEANQIDLSEGGLPLAIIAQGLSSNDLVVKWNEAFGRMELSKNNSLDIFITQDTLSCTTKKQDIESGIFDVSYIENTDSLIFYKTTLPDGSTPYWHFFASFKLGGVNYNFENDPLIECTEKQVRLMTQLVGNMRLVKDAKQNTL